VRHDVFISYSSIDKAAAFSACATFEAAHIRCWIAPRDVAAGAEWAEQIIDAIEGAKIMVLLFSANSNESRQVRREIELAVSRRLTIMPMRLEQIQPTKSMAYYMAGVHWIDALTPPLEAHFRKMVGWIKPHLDAAPQAEPKPGPWPQAKAEPKPTPRTAPPRPAAKPPAAAGARRKSSSILADILYELFGVGGGAGGLKIGEAAKAIDAACALADKRQYDEAIAAYRALIDRIEEANVPQLDWNLSIALLNLGITYRTAGRLEQALDAYRSVVRTCGDIADELIEKVVAMAMNNHATLLTEMGRPGDALAIQGDLIARWSDTINTDLAQQVAMARLNRGLALGAMRRNDDAVAAYDEVIALTNLRVWPKFDEYVAQALVNKGARLAAMGRTDLALAAYDEVSTRFGSTREEVKRRLVAMAMRNRVVALRDAGRTADAATAADRMLTAFGASGDKAITEHAGVVRTIRSGL
jgi:tetratricopeptide (TPR) repeat protein